MGVVSEVLGNSGSGHRLEFNGRTYHISLIDQRVKEAFEKRLFEKSARALDVLRGTRLLTLEQFTAHFDELLSDFENGEYELLSPRGIRHLKTMAGMQLLLSLLIGCEPSELLPLVLAKQAEITQLVSLVVRESFPGVEFKSAQESSAPRSRTSEDAGEGADPN